MEQKNHPGDRSKQTHARLRRHRITALARTRTVLPVVLAAVAGAAQAQTRTLDFEVHLDTRSQLRPDLRQQRYDFVHTAETLLRSDDGHRVSTQWMFQRKYFKSRITLAEVAYDLAPGSVVKIGFLRLPFGIHDWQETYRSGLIDYAMPRVDYGHTGVDFAVPGLGLRTTAGRLQFEGAAYSGRSTDVWNANQVKQGASGRVQWYPSPGLIVGYSRVSDDQRRQRTPSYFANELEGIDVRFARPFLMLRGEALRGEIDGRRYRGAYLDAYHRLPGLPDWTATARWEELHPDARFRSARQLTLGMRWTVTPEWSLSLNWRTNDVLKRYPGTWVQQSGPQGDLIFQVYRMITTHSEAPVGK